MSRIRLDPRTLLGFKIIASGESATVLRSPKIGAKGCPIINEDAGWDAAPRSTDQNGPKLR